MAFLTIPDTLLPAEGLLPTLRASRAALMRRLQRERDRRIGGMMYSVHEGKPKSRNLPDQPLALWLHLARIAPEPDAPFGSNGFFGYWEVTAIIRDPGDDPHGFNESTVDEVIAGVIRVLTEEMADASLDSTVDDVEAISAEIAVGTHADLDLAEILIPFRVRHPLLIHERE